MTEQPASTSRTSPRRGLKKKLVLSMLVVGVIPLIIGMWLTFVQGRREIQLVNGQSFEALAVETARKLDLILNEQEAKTRRITLEPQLIAALERRRDTILEMEPATLEAQLAQEQEAWQRKDSALIRQVTTGPLATLLLEHYRGTADSPGPPIPIVTRTATRALFVTDLAGRVVASIHANIPYLHRDSAWWQGAMNKGVGQPYVSDLEFDPILNIYTFSLSLPIMDSIQYQAIGVLHRVYDAKEFFSPSIDTIRFGKTGHIMLIDSRGVVLSCPILPTGTKISDERLVPLVTPAYPGWVQAPSDGHGGTDTSIIGFAPVPGISRITQYSTGATWHMFVWQSSEELFAPIQHLFTGMTAFGLTALGLLIALGVIAANRIAGPIRRLQEAARLIGTGELQEPIQLQTGDELEELANEFNRMNEKLKEAFAALKGQVVSKTEEVQYLQESTVQILDSVPDPIFILDRDTVVHYLNRASKEALGLKNGVPDGASLFELLNLDPAAQQKFQSELTQLVHPFSGTPRLGLHPSFSPSTASLPSFPKDPLAPQPLETKPERERTVEIHHRLYLYDWFPVKTRPGEEPRIGLVLRDMTEQARLQESLTQNEKLASLGVLSAGIGHELNNPLVGVIGFGEAILEETDTAQIKEYAKNIVERGRRMATIIQDFTGLVRRQTQGYIGPIDLNEQLAHALQFVQLTEEVPAFSIRTDYQPIPPISAHPEDIQQAFVHLIKNAFQAMDPGGTLFLGTRCGNGLITVTVQDSGKGIPKDYLKKIFDPFFTTKQQGEGAGLGLTIVHRIVTKYGGTIHVESTEGQGTTFTLTFPCHQSVSTEAS
ncbi:MAG: sensor histidine kinase [Nitrospirae bacterium]|nr:MAG: sensor histidine kinase [Nitrospirota bacterium]